MSDKTVVVFTTNNARVFRNPPREFALALATLPNAVVNPDLSKVNGIAPHFWKFVSGEVLPMSESEREQRLKDIETYGADNSIRPLRKKEHSPRKKLKHYHVEVGLLIAILVVVCRILKKLS